jgi:hypothetical protein
MLARAAKGRATLWLGKALLEHLAKLASDLEVDLAEPVDRGVVAFVPRPLTKLVAYCP